MDFSNHSRGQKIEEDDAYMKDIKGNIWFWND